MGVTQEISRNCKEYSVFITIYSCSNFSYGSKLSSEDITKQKEDAVVLKTSVILGRSKDHFQSQGGCFLSLLSNLTRGKWRGITFSICRIRRALFCGLLRFTVTPRSEWDTAELFTLLTFCSSSLLHS